MLELHTGASCLTSQNRSLDKTAVTRSPDPELLMKVMEFRSSTLSKFGLAGPRGRWPIQTRSYYRISPQTEKKPDSLKTKKKGHIPCENPREYSAYSKL